MKLEMENLKPEMEIWMDEFEIGNISDSIYSADQIIKARKDLLIQLEKDGYSYMIGKEIFYYSVAIEYLGDAATALTNKKFNEALNLYVKVNKAFPLLEEALTGVCYCFYYLNEFNHCIKMCELTLNRSPNIAGINSLLGQCFDKLGKYQEAIINYKEEISRHKESAPILIAIGFCEFKAGFDLLKPMEKNLKPYSEIYEKTRDNFENSIRYYKKALELEPNNSDVIEAKLECQKFLDELIKKV